MASIGCFRGRLLGLLLVFILLDCAKSQLTQDEQLLFLETHNVVRGKVEPEAADMKFMEWDVNLAAMAQQWSDMCIFDHGQPTPNLSPDFAINKIGQNLFLSTSGQGRRPNAEGIVNAWFNEIRYYSYETGSCQDGKKCGHYTQIAWASTYAVGCGMSFCETADKTSHDNVWIATCNYGPNGNVRGAKPYAVGPSCTKCSTGIGQCYNNLCRPCSEHSEDCVCAQICNNCGEVDATACSCTCANGFHETDCSAICEDKDEKCGSFNGGYPPFWCDDDKHKFILNLCPVTCGLCVAEQDPGFECDTVMPQPSTCPNIECQNGGSFDGVSSCTCRCTPQYQGNMCQHNREQTEAGVILNLRGDLTLWPSVHSTLTTSIATILTTFCNDNFESCCLQRDSETPTERLSYVNESHVQLGDGYPEPREAIEGAFAAMFTVTPPESNDLCRNGGKPKARRRAASDIDDETRKRETTQGPYLDQDVFLEAMQGNQDVLRQELDTLGISLDSVEPGKIEPITPPGQDGLSAGAIAGIVIGCILLLALCVTLTVVAYSKRFMLPCFNSVKVLPETSEHHQAR
ncbi:uncharacterized protein [Asterias amurensis]